MFIDQDSRLTNNKNNDAFYITKTNYISATGGIYWRRPFYAALLYYLQVSLKLLRPIIVIKALIFLPLSGDFATAALYHRFSLM